MSRRHDFNNMEFDTPNKNGTRMRTVFCRNKRFIHQTPHWLCVPSTFEEIFNHLKPYFDKYVDEYKTYKIYGTPITNSIFRLVIFFSKEQKDIDLRYGKILYEIETDNINKNKLKYKYKNIDLLEKDKEKVVSFYVNIEVELFNENSFFQYDGEKDSRIEDVCILCHKNKPNVLITKCFHLVACSDCLNFNDLYRCPCCDKPYAGIHKVTFAVSKKK